MSIFWAAEDGKKKCECLDSSHCCSLLLYLMRQFKEKDVGARGCLWSHNYRIFCCTVFCTGGAVLKILVYSFNIALEGYMRETVWSFAKTAGAGICLLSVFIFDDYTWSIWSPFNIKLAMTFWLYTIGWFLASKSLQWTFLMTVNL